MKTGSTSEVGQRWRVIIIEGSPEDRAEFRRLLLSGWDRDYAFEECLTGASGLTAIDAAGHSLIIELPDEPLWLHADPTRMIQILANLMSNSANYTQPGGGIALSARRHDDTVVISVADNGLGISADIMGRVFDMFTQVNPTLERAQSGLGIGLALVKRLVAMHGGAIEAHSNGVKRSQYGQYLHAAFSPGRGQHAECRSGDADARRRAVRGTPYFGGRRQCRRCGNAGHAAQPVGV